MNTKIYFAAIAVAVVSATTDAQIRFCEPACGDNKYANPNAFISTCCLQYEASNGANFDACCASSCNTKSPCNWDGIDHSEEPAVTEAN
ncbi:hypothetical protein P3T76_014739 [Phytophthora citrophthora]|uniref:Phytotoxin PcF domain-containing protein n=1 Tax=Phytophthora citrophthora TaxID=4793 RepID=A0AAD9G0I4_9STRA|nr:hypothetical protein P3T76_014739 [Phytophthora citrophthora]